MNDTWKIQACCCGLQQMISHIKIAYIKKTPACKLIIIEETNSECGNENKKKNVIFEFEFQLEISNLGRLARPVNFSSGAESGLILLAWLSNLDLNGVDRVLNYVNNPLNFWKIESEVIEQLVHAHAVDNQIKLLSLNLTSF